MHIQLCYASQRVDQQHNLLEDLTDILATARSFNQRHQIFGVLYYADGYYFQCLEGEQHIVETLFNRIKQDQRHTDVLLFPITEISSSHFAQWSMKYVKPHSKIGRLFTTWQYQQFLPHHMNQAQLQQFLAALYRIDASEPRKIQKNFSPHTQHLL